MSILANLLSAGSLAQSLLYNMVYDVGKAGVKKVFRLDSDENTKTAILTGFSQIKGDNKKIEMMLGQLFTQNEVIAAYLIALTKELGMGTKVQFKDGHLAVEIPPEDKAFQKKLEGAAPISPLRIAEHPEVVSALGLNEDTVLNMVAELDNLKLDVEALAEKIKNVVITPQNTVKPNAIFNEALERKTRQEKLIYEVSKRGFYAFSREKVRTELAAYPQFYISDKRGENIRKATASDRLSDDKTIVFKVDISSGYIFAISEKVVL